MIAVNDLAAMVADISGKSVSIENVPGPQGVRGRNSDNRLLEHHLGWAPSAALREGMEKTYRWILEQQSSVA
jgi:nucleoside-diphosphate-sugar epimerase